MTDSAGSGQQPVDPQPAGAAEPGHRVRRRRRAASRPAGPPDAAQGRSDDAAAEQQPVAVAEMAADTAGALDPVEKSDRRREKKRRNRSERLAAEAAAAAAAATPAAPQQPARARRPQSDRGMHGLEGNRATQLPSTEAMRAREWAAPGPDDLAAAEAELVIVRRHYRPPEPLPTKKQPPGQDSRTGSRSSGERRRPRD